MNTGAIIAIAVVVLLVILGVGYYVMYGNAAKTGTTSNISPNVPNVPSPNSTVDSAAPINLGCYKDDAVRALNTDLGNFNSVNDCLVAAKKAGFKFAGVQFGGQCFAGNSGYDKYGSADLAACSYKCSNGTGSGGVELDKNMACGGSYSQMIYQLSK